MHNWKNVRQANRTAVCLKKEEGCNHIVAEEVVLTKVLGTVIVGVQSVVTQFARVYA